MKKILVIGANGQIGTELVERLRAEYGARQVIASDIRDSEISDEHFVHLDAMNKFAVEKIIDTHQIQEVYLMAAILSAKAEKNPNRAWDLNMTTLFNLLEIAKNGMIEKLFWPSSIAVFGPHTPVKKVSQYTIMDPNTVYGISKLSGERWVEYYKEHFDIDVRSVRYPGIVSWKTLPGGGTTDYAVEIFHEALKNYKYTCFLKEKTRLPMMYMPDAVDATIDIMKVPKNRLSIHNSYNVAGISFTPEEIAESIKKHIPDFSISYRPDFRQKIADSWPESIDDSVAKNDWNWQHRFGLEDMVEDMLKNLSKKK